MLYSVVKQAMPLQVNACWNKPPWDVIDATFLQYHMGRKPSHFPSTAVKISYSNTCLQVMFQVQDQYVKAVAVKDQDRVCSDSCVEFFFTPGEGSDQGYFNLEMNCGGTMLFHYRSEPGNKRIIIPMYHCRQINRIHSLPSIVNPAIAQPISWTLAYEIPFALLEKYCPVTRPAVGVIWRANLYKCADQSSHPHWLTWAPVGLAEPDFHQPQFFGRLAFS